jgi:hypothetical protein
LATSFGPEIALTLFANEATETTEGMMPRRNYRKKQSLLGTLFIELSAIAGILGISQPTLRDNLWALIRGTGGVQQTAPLPLVNSNATKFQSLPENSYFETVDQQARRLLPQHDRLFWATPSGFE